MLSLDRHAGLSSNIDSASINAYVRHHGSIVGGHFTPYYADNREIANRYTI